MKGARRRRPAAEDAKVLREITDLARRLHREILARKRPALSFPVRALSNVKYDESKGYFEIGNQRKTRTLEYTTIKSFAQTLRMMALAKELVETDDFATKRDAYYQSKNWEEARFDAQEESDAVMDDIEALFSVKGINREMLRFFPEEKGGEIAGRLVVIDRDLETGKPIRIDCTKFGTGAYSTPSSVEHLKFETKAKFILAIETGGMFQRLAAHKFWAKADCILVNMGGVPTRACRRFIRRLADEFRIPVYAFSVAGDETFWYLDPKGRLHLSTFEDLARGRPFRKARAPFPNERSVLRGRSLAVDARGLRMADVRRIVRHDPTEPGYEVRTPQGFSVRVTRSHSITVFDARRGELADKRPEALDRRTDFLLVSLDIPDVQRLRRVDLARETGLPSKGAWLVPLGRGRGRPIRRWYEGKDLVALARFLGTYAAEGHAERSRLGLSFGRSETARMGEVVSDILSLFGIHAFAAHPHETETQLTVNSAVLARAVSALSGRRAEEKRVPDFLFSAPNDAKKAFLEAYFLGDGGVSLRKRNSALLVAKTTSRLLAYGVVALLAQLGGTAHIRKLPLSRRTHRVSMRRRGKKIVRTIRSKLPVYEICITSRASLAIVREVLRRKGYRFEKYFASPHRKASTFESLPKEVVVPYRPLFRKWLRGRLERLLPPSAFQGRRISKVRLAAVLTALDAAGCDEDLGLLRSLVASRATLLPIRTIARVPIEGPVYDIEMTSVHRFFASFVAVHNTDCDPYGIANIYRSLKVGSGNAAHISRFFCVPQARFLGVTPQDIEEYDLPTHPLKEVDIKRARDALKNDPFFRRHKEWQKALTKLVEMGVRAEQQALAKWGLNYVIEEYLPRKLKKKDFLP